ncbi:MAG TPA: ABC transporter permease, partial [Bacilli bacterium]
MSNLLWLVRKTLFNTFRSKKKWASYIGLPLVGVIVSFLIYGNVHGGSLRIGIVNADGHAAITQDAIAYVSGLQAVKVTNVDNAELNRQLVAGKLDVGLVFKEGFGQSVRNGHPDGVSIVSVKGAQVTRYTKVMLDAYIANIAAIGKASGTDNAKFRQMYHDYRNGTFQVTARTLGDVSAKKSTGYQSIGFLLLFMLFSAFNMTDLILKEKENRTYYRQLSSPVTARTYILANVTVSILVLALQIMVTLFVMKYAFHLAEGVSLLETGSILLLFGLGAVSLSLMF